MYGGGGGRVRVKRLMEPPRYRKSRNGINSNHFLEREKSGNIKKRSW